MDRCVFDPSTGSHASLVNDFAPWVNNWGKNPHDVAVSRGHTKLARSMLEPRLDAVPFDNPGGAAGGRAAERLTRQVRPTHFQGFGSSKSDEGRDHQVLARALNPVHRPPPPGFQ